MDKTSLMHAAQRARERDRDAQKIRYVQSSAKQSVEWRPAGILKHQRHAVIVARQRDGSCRPVSVKFSSERIFVFKPLDATERGFFRGNQQDRRQAPVELPPALLLPGIGERPNASRRMHELGDRVSFFKMRATREDIERSGSKASRAEFDAVIDAIANTKTSTIVDVGANTSVTFFTVLSEIAPTLADEGLEFGACVVVTNEPGALAEAPKLLLLATPWTKARFLVENRLHGAVDATWLKKSGDGAKVSSFDQQSLEEGADDYLQQWRP